jgi:hypothetical protein
MLENQLRRQRVLVTNRGKKFALIFTHQKLETEMKRRSIILVKTKKKKYFLINAIKFKEIEPVYRLVS